MNGLTLKIFSHSKDTRQLKNVGMEYKYEDCEVDDITFYNINAVSDEKKITVTEKRAPTDESIRLLNDFTQAAKDNIIDTIHIQNNIIDCVAIFYRMSPLVDDYEFALRFKLNGSEHKLSGVINRMDLEGRDAHYGFRSKAVLDLFVDSYSKVIAIELMRMDLKGASAIL